MPSQNALAAAFVARWRGNLLDLLFPPRCVSCHRAGGSLCARCMDSIQPILPPYCQRCGHPLICQAEPCFHCRLHPLHLSQIRAVAFHEGALREAVLALKYNHRRDVAAPLADLLQQHIKQNPLEFELITAVPLHRERERERGYNQAELLAKELAPRAGVPYVTGLKRTRPTQDQIGLSLAARHENVRGAFEADAERFRNRRVLLVDDVCTTGATLDACGLALHSCGALLTYGLVVARPR
jgi:ComF family protein